MNQQMEAPAETIEKPTSATVGEAAKGIANLLRRKDNAENAAPPEDGDIEAPDDGDLEDIEEDSSEESDLDEDEVEDSKFVPITLELGDGEAITFESEMDLKNAVLRHSDYTKKTQALSEQQKQFQERAQQFEQQLVQQAHALASQLQLVEAELAGVNEPDWDKLEGEDLKHALAAWKQHQADLQVVRQRRMEEQQRVQQHQQKMQQQTLQREWELLLSAMPEWKNETVRQRELGKIQNYAKSLGFSDQEFAQIVDHRFFKVLHDAAQYADFDKKAPKPVRKGSKPAAPGQGRTNSTSRRKQQRRKQMRESGRLSDAAKALKDIL